MKKIVPILAISIVLAIALGAYYYWKSAKPVTYGGGRPVPARSQAEAKRAGYYCPSWDPIPGQPSSYSCIGLDR